jgi:hypothetical protein
MEAEVKTIIAAFLSTLAVRDTRSAVFFEISPITVIIAFSLIAVLAALCMAIYCPLPKDIYAAPMNVT